MPFLVGQLVYTSFPKVGFQSLISRQVPLEVEQAFLHDIVYRYWDAYNPPPSGYRAAYVYQIASDRALLGWLYNEDQDDLGRSHIPYFIAYYLAEPLTAEILKSIWHYLETGPITTIDRQNPPTILDAIALPDTSDYPTSHLGVPIEPIIRHESEHQRQEGNLLNIAVAVEPPQQFTPPLTLEAQIQQIFEEFSTRYLPIESIILISREGEPIFAPLDQNTNRTLTIADTMLYLVKQTYHELGWQDIGLISVRGTEGYLILAHCHEEIFLLVQTKQVLTGFLEIEINRIIRKLQTVLHNSSPEIISDDDFPQLNETEVLTDVDDFFDELDEDIIFEAEEEEVTYRGRRTNL